MANLNIFTSATSISSICFFATATVSSPYTIAGLTTELYTFPFTLAGNLLLQIIPGTLLHPFHSACTLFFTSLYQLPLSCTINPKYLNSFTLSTFASFIFTVSLSFSPFMHRYSVFDQLTFIPLLFNAYFQDSNLCSTSSLVSSQITISSTNSIVHDGSLLISSVSPSIITANRNGLNADAWCSPVLVAHTFPLFLIFSYSITGLPAKPCRKLSLGPQIHNEGLFDLPCTFPMSQTLFGNPKRPV